MHAIHPLLRHAAAVAFLGVAAVLAPAQLTTVPESKAPEMETTRQETKIERKQPGFWHRPSKGTPAEQLAYANDLKARGNLRRATNEHLALVHEWHDAPQAVTSQWQAANLFLERGKYERAFEEFQYLFIFFAGRFQYEEALESQFKIANSILEKRYMGFFGLKGFKDPQPALPLFQQIARNAPFWKHAPEVQFHIGEILEDTDEDADAADAYAVVGQRYPASPFAGDAALQRALCLRRISQSCPRDETRCRAALSACAAFLRDYPAHPGRAEAELYCDELKVHLATMYYERALFYDRIARRPKAAIIAYGDFRSVCHVKDWRDSVDERIAELEALTADGTEKKSK